MRKFNPLISRGLETDKNVSSFASVIQQMADLTGLAFVKKGEFSANFNYTTIPEVDRAETDLYLVMYSGLKDVNFGKVYKRGDLLYWKNSAWNLIANTESDFSTNDYGLPMHRGSTLIRADVLNISASSSGENYLWWFPSVCYLFIQSDLVSPSTVNINSFLGYDYQEPGKTCNFIVQNDKNVEQLINFNKNIFGCSLVVLCEMVVPAKTTSVFQIIKRGAVITVDSFSSLKDKAVGYSVITGTNEAVNGYYNPLTGVFTSDSGFLSKKIDISLDKTGTSYFVTSTTYSTNSALAVYLDANGVFISSEKRGVAGKNTFYFREKLIVPTGTKWILLTNKNSSLVFPTSTYAQVEKTAVSVLTNIDAENYSFKTKKQKKIVWFGTSIPAEGGLVSYPLLVCSKLGAVLFNQSLGSSMVRATKSDGSMVGMNYMSVLRSFSHTLAEKQALMDYWSTGLDVNGNIVGGGTYGWRDLLTGTPPSNYTTFASAASILSWSYETMLVSKYLDSSNVNRVDPDIFVFDFGRNDTFTTEYDSSDAVAIGIPTPYNSRATFCGAMNYIIDIILAKKPRARILFIGHYESDRGSRTYQAQQTIATYTGYPLLKLWEKTGWRQRSVQTNGYWSGGIWYETGGALTSKTITQIWMEDDIHPASLVTREFLANIITPFIEDNF